MSSAGEFSSLPSPTTPCSPRRSRCSAPIRFFSLRTFRTAKDGKTPPAVSSTAPISPRNKSARFFTTTRLIYLERHNFAQTGQGVFHEVVSSICRLCARNVDASRRRAPRLGAHRQGRHSRPQRYASSFLCRQGAGLVSG